MKRSINISLMVYFLITHLVSAVQSVKAGVEGAGRQALSGLPSSRGIENEWQRVNPQGEEISILTPGTPTVLKRAGNFTLRKDGERVLAHRTYSAYADSFIFAIESYKASRPQRILSDLENSIEHGMTFDHEVSISGFSGKLYRGANRGLYEEKLSFTTKQHVYLITLVALDENSPSIPKFLSGLILGEKISSPASGYVVDMKESDIYRNALRDDFEAIPPQAQVFTAKETSRKARIALRPEPQYTEEARKGQVTGTVVLRAVFDANGQVNNVRVVKGLKGGLTGQAVEKALHIRFFPAEIDGKPVSQYFQLEYNFNLY